MTTDALADALAREEHRQGMPLGKVDHCETCNEEATRKAYAALVAYCQHEDWIDITPFGELPGTRRICAVCGTAP